jgi:hypothetical protein
MATITDKGLELSAKLLNGVSVAPFTALAIGEGTTAEANGQTALVTEYLRGAATCTYEADYKAVWSKAFSIGASKTITEVGVFDNNLSGGNMLLRHKLATTKSVDNGDTLTVTVKVTTARV